MQTPTGKTISKIEHAEMKAIPDAFLAEILKSWLTLPKAEVE